MKNQVTISWERNQKGDLDVSWQLDPRVKVLEVIEAKEVFSDFLEIKLINYIERRGIRPSLIEDLDLNIAGILEEEEEDHVPDTRNMKNTNITINKLVDTQNIIGPKKEDYGYHEKSGFDDEQSGWTIEGGEEAYEKAVAQYKDVADLKKEVLDRLVSLIEDSNNNIKP